MPPERPGLAAIVRSGAFEEVHYALAMAAAAGAVGRPATLFFTLGAIPALAAGEGWRRLRAGDGRPAGEVDADYRQRGIAGFEELLAAAGELGVRLMVCEMGLRATGLGRGDLRPDLALEEGGLATLLLEAAGADLVYV